MKQTFIKKLAGALACCLLTGSIFGASPTFTVRAQETATDALVTSEVSTENSEAQLPGVSSETTSELTLESTTYATTTYTLTVNGGLGSGSYPAGMRISIIAEESKDGAPFEQWTVISGEASIADAFSVSTTVTMPESDVEITATYKHIHTVSSEWSYDETTHWHACACGYKEDETAHTESDWITETEATDTIIGKEYTECATCKMVMQTKEVYLALEIVTQPQNVAIHSGETATFSVEATGTHLSYQWQYSPNSNTTSYTDIDGATEATYTTEAVSFQDPEYKYRCVITNPIGEVISSAAAVTILDIRPVRMLNLNANGSISGIANPILPTDYNSPWRGTKVYFGSFDADADGSAEPILFRVLDTFTTAYGDSSMLLDCDSVISKQIMGYEFPQTTHPVQYTDSPLHAWLNSTSSGNFLESFTSTEHDSITVSDEYEKVFLPGTDELSNTAYGYHEDFSNYFYGDDDVVSRIKYNVASRRYSSYWTRDLIDYGYALYAFTVSSTGNRSSQNAYGIDSCGVSPVLNLSSDSVLFAGTCDMDKTAPLSAVGLAPVDNNVWTLTLKDITKTVDIQDGSVASLDAETGLVTVPYVYYGNGINQISVMITSAPRTEETAEILYYGKLETENSFDTATGSGIGTFTLPADLPEGYAIYLLAEEIREGNYTDSASEPMTLHLAYAPTLPEAGDDGAALNGIHQAADSNYYYYVEGIVDTSVNGLIYHDVDGKWYYFENGKLISTKYDIVEFGEAKYFVANGCLQNDASNSGLQLIGDNFYYLAYGQLQEFHSGLALYDGQWFYVENGVLAIDFSGLQDYDGSKFLISYGQIQNSYTGLYYDNASGNWYYIVNGQVQTFYTGLVLYDGAWFYLVNGRLANEFTGTVEYDGAQFEVYCGQVVTG